MKEANLVKLRAIIYSTRFWQYYFMSFFSTFFNNSMYKFFAREQDDSTPVRYESLLRMLTCFSIGFVYTKLKFKYTFIGMILLNGIASCLLYKFCLLPESELVWMFYVSVVIDSSIDTMVMAAVPKTFGLKWGILVLCIIQTGDVLS